MLLRIEPATDKKYKYVAHFSDGKKTKFGAKGYEDYTTHHDDARRDSYRKRHAKDLDTKDPQRAGYLSYYILWGDSTDINKNIRAYNARFFK